MKKKISMRKRQSLSQIFGSFRPFAKPIYVNRILTGWALPPKTKEPDAPIKVYVNGGRPIHRKYNRVGRNAVCPVHSNEAGRLVKAKNCGCVLEGYYG